MKKRVKDFCENFVRSFFKSMKDANWAKRFIRIFVYIIKKDYSLLSRARAKKSIVITRALNLIRDNH